MSMCSCAIDMVKLQHCSAPEVHSFHHRQVRAERSFAAQVFVPKKEKNFLTRLKCRDISVVRLTEIVSVLTTGW